MGLSLEGARHLAVKTPSLPLAIAGVYFEAIRCGQGQVSFSFYYFLKLKYGLMKNEVKISWAQVG